MTKAEDVRSRQDLIEFLNGVTEDLRAGRLVVENSTVPSFVGGMAGWLEDMDGYFRNRGEEPPESASWRLLAMVVSAGLVYE